MAVTGPFRRMGGRWWINRVTPWLLTLLLMAALVLSLIVFKCTEVSDAAIRRRPVGNTKPETAQAEPGCSHVYRLSSVSYRLEETWPDVAGCVAPLLTPPLLRRCVTERAHRRRRPTSILMLGDSRMRTLYQHLADELGVPTTPINVPAPPDWQKGIRWDNSPERWCQVCPWHCCPRADTSDGVSLRFEWLPFWTEAMVAELEMAADRCERGQDDCPDLVLVNGAMWYSGHLRPLIAQIGQMALLLRVQLARAAAALARLAALTRTVWKLDENRVFDIVTPDHRSGLPAFPVLHSLVYDALRKIPGLVIWSSSLPDSSGFLRQKCYPLVEGYVRNRAKNRESFFQACGPDAIHAGKSVMTSSIQTMFTELCSEYLDFSALELGNENRRTQSPICCSPNTLAAKEIQHPVLEA